MSIPILLVGDSPSLQTGLARIGRDIALGITRTMPQLRLAYLGRGGITDARLPFTQYTYAPTASDQWGSRYLAEVWANHANGQPGIVFTVGWDPSRLTWFGNPQPLGGQYAATSEFLRSSGASVGAPFQRWGYFAIDAEGPCEGGALPPILARTVAGYDRVLAYSQFGKRVLEAGGAREVDWLPHGINAWVFAPQDRGEVRAEMSTLFGHELTSDHTLIGCVMANQERKDWGLWAAIARRFIRNNPTSTRLWAHTDSLDRYWDLRVLVEAFGLAQHVAVTADAASDAQMARRYSACDVTILPSLGEGFGYPLVESLACGVPVVHGNYASGAEYTFGMGALVPARAHRYDTRWCAKRPVFAAAEWEEAIVDVLEFGPGSSVPNAGCVESVAHLDWRLLWPRAWQKWIERGLEAFGA